MRLNVRCGVVISHFKVTQALEKRTVGVRAFLRAFETGGLLYGKLQTFRRPVYVTMGDLTHPVEEAKAKRLVAAFLECCMEVYIGCHHWAPPQMAQPERYADSLRKLWTRRIKS